MSSNALNDYKIVKSKKLLIAMLSMTTFLSFANANSYHINKPSEAEAMQIVENPENQNKVELAMFILKSIEEKQIKNIDKKIDFVNSLPVSDEVKRFAKSIIQQGINYSDHEKTSYGIYRFKNCKNFKNNSNVKSLPDYLPLRGWCVPQQWYQC